jgi:hypothetical protein
MGIEEGKKCKLNAWETYSTNNAEKWPGTGGSHL